MKESAAPARAANDTTTEFKSDQSVSFKVEERLSQELVIALVGPVASGVSTAGQLISRILDTEYGYTVEYIKVSPLIKARASEIGETIPDNLVGDARIEKYQQIGNRLREHKGDQYLADCAIDRIALARQRNDGFFLVSMVQPQSRNN